MLIQEDTNRGKSAFPVPAKRGDDSFRFLSMMLHATHLFDKRTASTVHHEDVRSLPSIRGLWETLGLIHIWVTEIRVGIVDILGDGTAVGRNTEKGLPVVVALLLEETVRDLQATVMKRRSNGE